MKKLISSMVLFMVCLSSLVLPISAEEATNVEKMNELQDDISSQLVVEGDHYMYDSTVIGDLIMAFDIDAFNKETGLDFTTESLKEKIFYNIDNFVIPKPTVSSRGSYCDRNYKTSGWNYDRWYTSQATTNEWINELNTSAAYGGGTSILTGLLGFLPGNGGMAILGTGLAISSFWQSGFAGALARNNTTCGLVSDVNTIYGGWYIDQQLYWYTYE